MALKYLLFLCFVSTAAASAQVRFERAVIQSPDPTSCYHFGKHVAAWDDWVFVASPTCSGPSLPGGGSVSVYKVTEQGFGLRQQLHSDFPVQGFGTSGKGIAVADGVLAVTDYSWPNVFNPQGQVHVFELVGEDWVRVTGLFQPVSVPQDYFASNIAADQGLIAVSAPGATPAGTAPGSFLRGVIYFFERVQGQWTLVQEWGPPDDVAFDYVGAGWNMTLQGDSLAWAANNHNAVMFLKRNANGVWDLDQIVTGIELPWYSGALWSLDLDQDRLVVGVHGGEFGPPGYVRILERSNGVWSLGDRHVPWDGTGMSDGFGEDVAFQGDLLAVGAPYAQQVGGGPDRPGAVYLFRQDPNGHWLPHERLSYSAGDAFDRVGSSIALDGDRVVAGAPTGTLQPLDALGLAFVWELPMGDVVCAGQPNSTGAGAELEVQGLRSSEENWLHLEVRGVPTGSAGVFIAGTEAGFVSHPLGSQGNLCVGGQFFRLNQTEQIGIGNDLGAFGVQLDTTRVGGVWGPGIVAGETWFFQAWYRDSGLPAATNLSSAVSLTFE